jgi:nucleoside-diphosphate-sugar epimerase
MKNILITGGTGYIGSNLIDKLLSKEFRIFALYNNNKSEKINDNLHWIKYNGSFDSLTKITQKIDIILHLATLFSPKHSIDVIKNMINSNILLGVHLLEFAKENNIKSFINTSTYAQSIDGSAYNPQNFYTATKGAFESILKFYTESGVVNNITLSLYDTYGPNDTRPKFINLVLNNLNSAQIFNMSLGEQEIRYIYIDDVTEAYYLSIELLLSNKISKSQTFSICGKETFTLNELVRHVGNIYGKKIETNPGFYPYRDREIMRCNPKFPILPGWEPKTNIEQGIKQIIGK